MNIDLDVVSRDQLVAQSLQSGLASSHKYQVVAACCELAGKRRSDSAGGPRDHGGSLAVIQRKSPFHLGAFIATTSCRPF
jgi:hypothetical protein